MRMRQIVFAVNVVLILSSQAIASVTHDVQGSARSYFVGQSPLISIQASGRAFVSFENIEKHGTVILAGMDRSSPFWPVADRNKTIGLGEAGSAPSIVFAGAFSTNRGDLRYEWPSVSKFDVSNMASLLNQPVLVSGIDLKNVTTPNDSTRVFRGSNDDRQRSNNIGELNLAVNPVPAPIAIVIGSIGVGIIGWMRVNKTYTV